METTVKRSKSAKTGNPEDEDDISTSQNVKTTTSTMNLINFYVVAMLIRAWLLFGEGNIMGKNIESSNKGPTNHKVLLDLLSFRSHN